MGQQFTDGARALTSAALADTDTTISIADSGALFPVASAGDMTQYADINDVTPPWFKLVLQDDTGIEIVYVGTHADSATTFTDVLRGQEGTTARAFASGSVAGLRVTAVDMARVPATAAALADLDFDTRYYPRADADAAMKAAAATLGINAQTGTTYTLALSDAGGMVTMTNAAANSVGVPANSSVAFPVGTVVYVMQNGAGATSVTAGVGVTINTPTGLNVPNQYESVGLVKVDTDTWNIVGAKA